jgi:hypothetical protein
MQGTRRPVIRLVALKSVNHRDNRSLRIPNSECTALAMTTHSWGHRRRRTRLARAGPRFGVWVFKIFIGHNFFGQPKVQIVAYN